MINIKLYIGQSNINKILKIKSVRNFIFKHLNLKQINVQFNTETYDSKQIIIYGMYTYGFLFKKMIPIKIRIKPFVKEGKFKFYIEKIIANKLPITIFIKLKSRLNEMIYKNNFINILFNNSIYIDSKILDVLEPKNIIVGDKFLMLEFQIGD